ncbi:MAG: uroporphyrinogen-III synthase, partial [Candidatus Omnitrophota bacterium]
EEALVLVKAGVPFEIVPGVSSSIAAAAYAGIPVTYRKLASRVTIVTGHESPDKSVETIEWQKILDRHSTLVILMGMANLAKITGELIRGGNSSKTPVAVIENATLPVQKVVTGTLSNIADKVRQAGLKPPSVIVVGRVVGVRKSLDWFKPSFAIGGQRVLVTRPLHQAKALADLLCAYGASVVRVPLIKIVPAEAGAVASVLRSLGKYRWIVFSSTNGVDCFMDSLKRLGIDPGILRTKQLAAIGRKTAERLEAQGYRVALTPKDYVQEALAAELTDRIKDKSQRLLLVQSEEGRPVLMKMLKKAKFRVDRVTLYSTVPETANYPRARQLLAGGKIDALVLTSSSCVRSFAALFSRDRLKRCLKGVTVAAIGPITARTARRAGVPVSVMSRQNTVEGVAEALALYYESGKRSS